MFLLILSHIQMIYHAVGSGLGLPFKKQLLPVAENNTKKCTTDFVLALCNVMAKDKIYLSAIQYMTFRSAQNVSIIWSY